MTTWWSRWCLAGVVTGMMMGQTVNACAQQRVASEGQVDSSVDAVFARRISVRMTRVSLVRALTVIAASARIQLLYQIENLPADTSVTLDVTRQPLGDVLTTVLARHGLRAVVVGPDVVSLEPTARRTHLLGGTITGRITDDSTKRPIGGAAVTVASLPRDRGTWAATSGDDGAFRIARVPAGEYRIGIRRVGYEAWQTTVHVQDDSLTRLVVALRPTATHLNEVVTTAMGRQRRAEVGSVITTLNVDSILQTAPILSVTDLLESRVPGLTVLRTSGSPGAPSRIRLRGVNSITRNNDPIVIVDGVRINASEQLSQTLAPNVGASALQLNGFNQAPSPLDQIDPNSIQTIEVSNGPSAAALYGADAANGVIVITTKHGRPGPMRWTAAITQGLSYLPGDYPLGIFRFGNLAVGSLGTPERLCTLQQLSCIIDSVRTYQALNDPRVSILSTGYRTGGSASLSGGSSTLMYDVTGSGSTQSGMFRLPSLEQARYRALIGTSPPGWMVRPEREDYLSGGSRIIAQMTPTFQVGLSTQLNHTQTRNSSLSALLPQLMGTYVDPNQYGAVIQGTGGSPLSGASGVGYGYGLRIENTQFDMLNTVNAQWQPVAWLPVTAVLGLESRTDHSEQLLPYGLNHTLFVSGTVDTGSFSVGRGEGVTKTASIATAIPLSLGHHWALVLSLGANGTSQSYSSISGTSPLTTPGLTRPTYLPTTSLSDLTSSSYGFTFEPRLTLNSVLTISPGYRLDAGSNSGNRSRFSPFPKTNVSWFACHDGSALCRGPLSELRLRTAYGIAGTQPSANAKLRLLTDMAGVVDGQSQNLVAVTKLGNTELRPERSKEWEWGADAGLWHQRMQVSVTTYRKILDDALLDVPIAPSVGVGNFQTVNIGRVRNTGVEATAQLQLLDRAALGWNVGFGVSKRSNMLMSLAPGMTPITLLASSGSVTRIVPGYPLFGRWARPVVGYGDEDHNGIITPSEVRVGDTAVFMGAEMPNYEATYNNDITILHGRISVHTVVTYSSGMTQVNLASAYFGLSNAANDSTTPLAQQAALVAPGTDYGVIQTVNMLRFQSLSVNYTVPPTFARRMRAGSMVVSIQGSNLGLHTNYRGKDPNVNAFSAGDQTMDAGQVPVPRMWTLAVRLGGQ